MPRKILPVFSLVQTGLRKIKKTNVHQGGWHYEPTAPASDMSVSGWQIVCLHSAQQAGIEINSEVHRAGIHYARRMCNDESGTVAYDTPNNHEQHYADLA